MECSSRVNAANDAGANTHPTVNICVRVLFFALRVGFSLRVWGDGDVLFGRVWKPHFSFLPFFLLFSKCESSLILHLCDRAN
jgi:hypothetical protein